MPTDFRLFLWLLKLGGLSNLGYLAGTFGAPAGAVDPFVLVPVRIFFAVSAYRCLFPCRYTGHVVFHDTVLSSVFVTRTLATFSEVSFVYLLAYVLRWCNTGGVVWVDVLAWLMVVQGVVSQVFVWGAILLDRPRLYFWEELGWELMAVANTIASAYLYRTGEIPEGAAILLVLSLVFGLLYVPWQVFHLRAEIVDARRAAAAGLTPRPTTWASLREGTLAAIRVRHRTTSAEAWGGLLGLSWMTGYWAVLLPFWVHVIDLVVRI